jgi:proline iminopeptidase
VGGHSWGANLALFYALAHPDRTLGVIYLAGTGLRWGWLEDARRRRLARLTAAERAELTELERRLARGEREATARFLRLWWSTDFADRRSAVLRDEQPLYRFPRDEDVFRAVTESYRAALHPGLEDEIMRLESPVLVLHGAHDTDPTRARRVADLAPRGRYVELERSAHSPWLEEPTQVRRQLRHFLAALA